MAITETEPYRRLTPTEREHELAMTLAQRRPPTGSPTFKVSQVKSVGGTFGYEWDVAVPVCDEFPTADLAFEATKRYAASLRAEYGPSGNGDA